MQQILSFNKSKNLEYDAAFYGIIQAAWVPELHCKINILFFSVEFIFISFEVCNIVNIIIAYEFSPIQHFELPLL